MSFDAILAKSPGIIYRPGGVSGGLVVTTWAEVQNFVALRQGAVVVYVDDGTAAAHVPAASGITDFFGRGEIRPYRQDILNYSTLIVDSGATLKGIFRLSGTIALQFDTRGATPGLDFDYTANVIGTPQPALFVDDAAFLENAATATNPACVIPNGEMLAVFMTERAGIFLLSAAVLFHTSNATSTLALEVSDSEVVSNGSAFANISDGPGITNYQFDSSTLTLSPIAPIFTTASTTKEQIDSHFIELTFLATTANVLGALQTAGTLPTTGLIRIQAEGFGGTGGGGGGQGGAAGPGAGGGGSGAALYQVSSFTHNLANPLNIAIGPGGAAGGAGAAGGGAGGPGADGLWTECIDPVLLGGTILVSFTGSSGGGGGGGGLGNGHGGAAYSGGIFVPRITDISSPYGSGFPGAGGLGGLGVGLPGVNGQNVLVQNLIPTGTLRWAGGTGGTSGGGLSGGGGGGGAGVFAPGGAGGNGVAAGQNGGGGSAPNSGAGVGGGSGGGGAADPGGAGAVGSIGWLKLSLIAP
jgi:hypothetical protein